jgi:hypothetical protein
VALEGMVLGTGEGRSRRDAETQAATMALATLAVPGTDDPVAAPAARVSPTEPSER